ncbi:MULTISPECIES: hypothetical protein [Leptospira]|uniref:hypothetical protein n=1 Tax=Leptospira TaxID=171 RepID=UPI001F2CCFDB|nr:MULTISPECIES: hypothetical protein [Leptospira]
MNSSKRNDAMDASLTENKNYWIWQDEIHEEDQTILKTRPQIIYDRRLYFDNGVLLTDVRDQIELGRMSLY